MRFRKNSKKSEVSTALHLQFYSRRRSKTSAFYLRKEKVLETFIQEANSRLCHFHFQRKPRRTTLADTCSFLTSVTIVLGNYRRDPPCRRMHYSKTKFARWFKMFARHRHFYFPPFSLSLPRRFVRTNHTQREHL